MVSDKLYVPAGVAPFGPDGKLLHAADPIATNNNVTTGLIIILKSGQSVELGVTRGSSFTMNCGTPPTDLVHLRYFSVTPAQ